MMMGMLVGRLTELIPPAELDGRAEIQPKGQD